MISSVVIGVFAEESTPQTQQPEGTAENVTTQDNSELIVQNEILTTTYGKIIDAKDIKQVVTGTITDTVQEVTVLITEGEYEGEEFTTNYVLSYDIEGKILAYELDKGDKVTVQITEDADGNMTVTVMDVVRSDYIILLFL